MPSIQTSQQARPWSLARKHGPIWSVILKLKNGSKLGFCRHGPNKSVNFIFGLGLGTWKRENLRLGLEWAFYMVNKKLFLRCYRFAKNQTVCPIRRFNRGFERFNADLTTNGSLKRIEPKSSPVDGSIGRASRSGPVFKTMINLKSFMCDWINNLVYIQSLIKLL